jgi:hypothetical protein
MEPRLKSSQKWTSLPGEIVKQIREVFTQAFPEATQKGRFLVEGRIYKQELLIRVGYNEHGRLKQHNFEVSIEYNPAKDNMMKMVHLAMDVCATLIAELFAEDDDADFPRIWSEFEADGRSLYVQYSGVNSDLEKQADALLGKTHQDLVEGEDEDELEEEREGLKRILGLTDDDEDEGGAR